MQTLNNNYIIGLIDGEGSFTVYIRNPGVPKTVKRRTMVEPKFYVKLIEEDKEILYRLKNFFGCGNVYFQKDNRPNHKNCYRYEVTKREDLEKVIIPFFKNNSLKLSSKIKDFKLFCELIKRISKKEHWTKSGLKKMYRIKQKMH